MLRGAPQTGAASFAVVRVSSRRRMSSSSRHPVPARWSLKYLPPLPGPVKCTTIFARCPAQPPCFSRSQQYLHENKVPPRPLMAHLRVKRARMGQAPCGVHVGPVATSSGTRMISLTARRAVAALVSALGWSGSMFAVVVDILHSTFKFEFAENS